MAKNNETNKTVVAFDPSKVEGETTTFTAPTGQTVTVHGSLENPVTLKPATAPAAPKKSDIIRSMAQEGMSVADIARATNSHYSFVYGVVKNMLGGEKPTADKGPSKSDEIREMAAQGKTPGEIAKALNSNYSFVHTVVKAYKKSLEKADK
jgi:DNA invertase Pin-like site-specific DNA recombinase